ITKIELCYNSYILPFGKWILYNITLKVLASNTSSMKTYDLIGKNISYSFSRQYFKEKFKRDTILNSQYVNFDIDNLSYINNIFNQNNKGYNVTIPYKKEIIPYLDSLD